MMKEFACKIKDQNMNLNDQKVYLFITGHEVDLADDNSKILSSQINNNFRIIQVRNAYRQELKVVRSFIKICHQ